MNFSLAMGLSVHQTMSLIMVAKLLDVIVGQPTMDTMNKMVKQMAQMVAWSKPPRGVVSMDPSRLSLTMLIMPLSQRARSPPPLQLLDPTPSTKKSHQHQPPSKSPCIKKQINSSGSLICRRRSGTLAFNTLMTALKSSASKSSMKSTSGMPTTPSKGSFTISKSTDARS